MELLPVDQQQDDGARVEQRAAALDDELEHAVEVGLAADRAGDRGGRLQAADGALRLGAAARRVLVEASVLDRQGRPVREHHRRRLVRLVERPPGLLGQVQVAPRLAADHHRHAQEAPHRRVVGREPVRARMGAHVVESQRRRVADQLAEHAVAAREVPDRLALGAIDAASDEPLEPAPVLVEDADRRIARPGELARHPQQLFEHRVDLQLRHQASSGLEQGRQPRLVERAEPHPSPFNQSVETRNRFAAGFGGRRATCAPMLRASPQTRKEPPCRPSTPPAPRCCRSSLSRP